MPLLSVDAWAKRPILPKADRQLKESKSHQTANRSSHKFLEFPDESHSVETVEREITAMYFERQGDDDLKGQLWFASSRRPLILSSMFLGWPTAPATTNPDRSSSSAVPLTPREQVFGKLSSMRRLTLPANFGQANSWRGILLSKGGSADDKPKLLMLDGDGMSLAAFDVDSGAPLLSRSIPWDLIKPAPDRGGEATTPETERLRARFKRLLIPLRLKITGMAVMSNERVPAADRNTPNTTTLVLATRIPEFPLLLARCATDDMSQCMITRRCNLEGAKDMIPDAVTGIAVSAKRKLIVIGDRQRRRLLGFRFDSCYNVQKVAEWSLPERFKKLSNVFIDESDRLWVTTSEPDDYLNANAYVWMPKAW